MTLLMTWRTIKCNSCFDESVKHDTTTSALFNNAAASDKCMGVAAAPFV